MELPEPALVALIVTTELWLAVSVIWVLIQLRRHYMAQEKLREHLNHVGRKWRHKYWWLVLIPFVNAWFLAYCLFDVLFGEEG